ncbi:helix-turn-helix transcriptional regulator [Eubacteriales bacterium OttesenSCG-928-A19]|nr:helix-turn-helix transcriptional regulator [Eubacteriales bacterium OttesenSCG-928-A19]
MIGRDSVARYRGPSLMRGPGFVYVRPDPLLAPYIANYTITCPAPDTMSDEYTVMPTASATLSYAVRSGTAIGGLRGVNTRASVVGAYANRFELLLLIEFHTGGLYPLLGIPQAELLDASFPFDALSPRLDALIRAAMLAATDLAPLFRALDGIFLSSLLHPQADPQLSLAMAHILKAHGQASARDISREVFYSEKHLGRLFRRHIGTGVKTFSRIVRVHHATRLLESAADSMAGIAAAAGYFDQPHFIHEFQALCGVSPQAYLERMSVFYNDSFKL